jgi:hypothetical protein
VTAAGESIWNDLINDEAIIDILNFATKFVETIDYIIDRLGGVETLISGISAIFFKMYSKDIGKGITGLIDTYSFKGMRAGK